MDSTDGAFTDGGSTRYGAECGTPRAAVRPRRGKGRSLAAILSAAATATVVAGCAVGFATAAPSSSAASAVSSPTVSPSVHNALRRSTYGFGGYPGYGGYGSGAASSSGGVSSSAGSADLSTATAAQEVGVVDITSELTYDQAEAAGTGLVLTSDGEILTNNHVVEGSTSISVTVVSTGTAYTATVIGTDATDDIAVLHLNNASGLSTAHLDTSTAPALGDAVTGVGNAGGTGGIPSAAPGTVTGLDQSITTQAEATAASETLHGLIETDADIQPGDSGGPLFNSSNQVIGIDTAAEQGSATVAGYAIPIGGALTIADEIEAGDASATVVIGYPAFLGVEVASSANAQASGYGSGFDSAYGSSGSGIAPAPVGAAVAGVIDGTPAAEAGLAGGDTITALNGTPVASAAALTQALAPHTPGQNVSISWTDATGASHSASVTLARGPVA